ncbi:MAG: DUF4959 domain-containing protein [Bacteroidales bacterium]|jgi:hypothetical protein|nr:DUF4959 domain-containing protein [Bacteroidales bacterium]
MKSKNIYLSIFAAITCVLLYACDESKRFEIGYDDSVPPAPPKFLNYLPLYGGATLWFEAPEDEDLLSIDATYINPEGKEVWFSVSFYTDSINVLGFSNRNPQNIKLFAVDRAGNKSEAVDVKVTPLKSAVSMLAENLYVIPGFSSFFVNWENELKQDMNVFVDYTYSDKGVQKEGHVIYTSNLDTEQHLVRNLNLAPQDSVSIKVRVEDFYGNTVTKDLGAFSMLEDSKIPKEKWKMPNTNDSIGGVPEAFLDAAEGRAYMIIDDIPDNWYNNNFAHTHWIGRTGNPKDGNTPWNIMIDLGDYYELSRIVTHQRHGGGAGSGNINNDNAKNRGTYYAGDNVGIYRMYTWDEDLQQWDSICTHKITFKEDLASRQFWLLGQAGDMAYMYPGAPKFTKPTRWFRYEALYGFNDNYKSSCSTISEITLYGKKAN